MPEVDPLEFLRGEAELPEVPLERGKISPALKFLRDPSAKPPERDPGPDPVGGVREPVGDFLRKVFPSIVGDQIEKDPLVGTRMLSIAAGGTLGAAAGLPLGPVGVGTGGALGALGGVFAPEALLEAAKIVGIPVNLKGLSPGKLVSRAFEEVLIEVATAGLGGLREPIRVGKNKILMALAGVTKESRVFAQMAKNKFKIELDIVTLAGERRLGRGVKVFNKVVGVFPFIRRWAVAGAQRRGEQVLRAADFIVDRIGPSVSVAIRSEVLNRSARLNFNRFGQEATRLYQTFKKLAASTGATFDPKQLRGTARRLRDEFEDARAKLIGRGDQKVSKKVDPLKGIIDELSQVANGQTIKQMDEGLAADINREIGILSKKGDKVSVGRLMEMKDALQKDIRGSINGSTEVVDALERADAFFSKGMKVFETGTALKFGRIDRNIFKIKFEAQTVTAKEKLFDILVKNATPSELRELRSLVGEAPFRTQVAGVLRDALEDSIRVFKDGTTLTLNIDSFVKSLGIGEKFTLKGSSLQGMLKILKQDSKAFVEFVEVAKVALSQLPDDLKQFVARRATLGGARGAVRVLLPASRRGQGVLKGFSGAILFTLGARRLAKILSDPIRLNLVKASMRSRALDVFKVGAFVRLSRLIIEGPEFSEETKDTFRNFITSLSGEEPQF